MGSLSTSSEAKYGKIFAKYLEVSKRSLLKPIHFNLKRIRPTALWYPRTSVTGVRGSATPSTIRSLVTSTSTLRLLTNRSLANDNGSLQTMFRFTIVTHKHNHWDQEKCKLMVSSSGHGPYWEAWCSWICQLPEKVKPLFFRRSFCSKQLRVSSLPSSPER